MSQLTDKDKKELFLLCRKVIEEKIFGKSNIELNCDADIFKQNKGAFVSIHISGRLRGCIGTIEAIMPLQQVVEKMALSSAFKDPRFSPLTKEEYPKIDLEISILSETEKVNPEDVIVGKHGVIISHKGKRGLLLPQVAIEQKWDREKFLSHTCLKASLPKDMWKKGATIEVFEADVFGEDSLN